jgi:hypothetical protein
MMAITDSYYKSRRTKKFVKGGPMTPEEAAAAKANGQENLGVAAGVAGIAGSAVDAIAPTNKYGRQATGAMAASGALKGAAAGAAAGPIGMAAGAVIGGAVGIIAGGKAKREEEKMITRMNTDRLAADTAAGNSRLIADPTLKTGSLSAGYFATGGPLSDPTPEQLAAWGNEGRTRVSPERKPFQVLSKAQEREQRAENSTPDGMSKWSYKGKYPGGVLGPEGNTIKHPTEMQATQTMIKYLEQPINSTPDAYLKGYQMHSVNTKPLLPVAAMGGKIGAGYRNTPAVNGSLVAQSSDGAVVNGPSHANGGVSLPAKGAEVEGGETIKDDFVYSAQLGFAQKHKPLMKAKGIIEQKPATPERINALKILEEKENKLALAQEYFKKKNRIK